LSAQSQVPPIWRILLAEDNPQDEFLLREALVNEGVKVELDCVQDGDELLKRLIQLDRDEAPCYGLVLLDAHLPRRNAGEVLSILSADNKSLNLPVVVLTTMLSEQDKAHLLALGVREVLSKPLDLNEYFSLARRLKSILLGNAGFNNA